VGEPQDGEEEPGKPGEASKDNKEPPEDKDAKEDKPSLEKPGKPSVQRSADNSPVNTGIMVAFMLKPEIAEQLALPNGEDPGDLHCTLAYLGRTSDTPPQGKLSPAATPDLIRIVLGAFAQGAQTLTGAVGGIGRFAASPQSDGRSPIYASPSVPGLQDFRRRLVDTLETAGYAIAKTWDYTPHITLAYIDADAPLPIQSMPSLPLIFDELCLVIGDDRYTFPLGQTTNAYTAPIEETDKPSFFGRAGSPGVPAKPNWPWRLS
jgi:2'-5' RNA ligase